jgi:carbon storage regulator
MRLVLSRKPDEAIVIDGGRIRITVCEVKGERVRFLVEAPAEIDVHREEVWLAIQSEEPDVSASQ